MTKRLIVVRHAKAEKIAETDRLRPLSERGREQADALGQALAAESLGSVAALVSSAVRTRETWELTARHLNPTALTERYADSLYGADVDDMLEEIGIVDDATDTVIVVGHNPTIEDLAWRLASDTRGDAPEVLRTQGYRPSTTTVYAVSGTWQALGDAATTLERYIAPLA